MGGNNRRSALIEASDRLLEVLGNIPETEYACDDIHEFEKVLERARAHSGRCKDCRFNVGGLFDVREFFLLDLGFLCGESGVKIPIPAKPMIGCARWQPRKETDKCYAMEKS